jgi:hypothetical protein
MESSQFWAVSFSPCSFSLFTWLTLLHIPSHQYNLHPYNPLFMYDTSNLPLKSNMGVGGGGVRLPVNKRLPRQNQYITPQHQQYCNLLPYNPLSHVYDTSNPPPQVGVVGDGGAVWLSGLQKAAQAKPAPTPHHQQHCNLTPTTLCFMYISNPSPQIKMVGAGGVV